VSVVAVVQVGLRPGRVRLRLESEHLAQAELQEAAAVAAGAAAAGGGELQAGVDNAMPHVQQGRERPTDGVRVVHCYGHGGSGLTLAWGTAGDAVQLAVEALQVPAA
jgi:D-amino-acid oxidase